MGLSTGYTSTRSLRSNFLENVKRKKEKAKIIKEWSLPFAGIALRRVFSGPPSIIVQVTHHCNMRCSMCESHGIHLDKPITETESYKNNKTIMDLGTFRSIIDDAVRLRTKRIVLSGKGEPALHPDFVSIIEYAKNRGRFLAIFTNGKFTKKRHLVSLSKAGVDEINLSLNAATPETHKAVSNDKGSFDHIVESFKNVYALKNDIIAPPKVILKFVIQRTNFREIPEMLRLSSELGAFQVSFTRIEVIPVTAHLQLSSDEASELKEIINAAKSDPAYKRCHHNLDQFISSYNPSTFKYVLQEKLPCFVGWLMLVIGPDGAVRPCCHLKKTMGYGGEGEKGLRDIWYSSKYDQFRKACLILHKTKREFEPGTCFSKCFFTSANQKWYNRLHPYKAIN